MRLASRPPGKALAYKRQPQDLKWVCTLCGRVPTEKREAGEPRYTRPSFPSKIELDVHIVENHE